MNSEKVEQKVDGAGSEADMTTDDEITGMVSNIGMVPKFSGKE
jgi:hypothetical protein